MHDHSMYHWGKYDHGMHHQNRPEVTTESNLTGHEKILGKVSPDLVYVTATDRESYSR